MNCRDFAELLERYLDGAADLRPELAIHAAACSDCREQLLLADRLAQLPRTPSLEPPPEWTARVVQAVLRDWRQRLTRQRWAVMALAASVLVAVGIGFWIRFGGRTGEPVPQLVQQTHPEPAPPQLTEPSREPVPQLTLAPALRFGQVSLDTTRNLAADAARQVAHLTAGPADIQPPPMGPDLMPKAIPDMSRSVSESLDPMVRSTRRAFDAWLDLLPVPLQEKPGL